MMTDTDIQVWLETDARTQPVLVVPYVQSSRDTELRYIVGITSKSPSGRSNLSQGGQVTLVAGHPGTLGKMSLTVDANTTCSMRIALSQYGQPQKVYDFSCSEILQHAKLR
jgi:hypothetical protein